MIFCYGHMFLRNLFFKNVAVLIILHGPRNFNPALNDDWVGHFILIGCDKALLNK